MTSDRALSRQNAATNRLERARRQVILMRIIEEQQAQKRNPTLEELAAMMRENHWVASRWPSYSAPTASKDYGRLMELVKDDIKVLAMPYFVRQMEIIDETVDTLSGFVNDDRLPHDTRIRAANSLGGYADRYMKIFGTTTPSESMHVQRVVTGDLDSWKKMQEEADKELLSREPIEGEWEDSESEEKDQGTE